MLRKKPSIPADLADAMSACQSAGWYGYVLPTMWWAYICFSPDEPGKLDEGVKEDGTVMPVAAGEAVLLLEVTALMDVVDALVELAAVVDVAAGRVEVVTGSSMEAATVFS
jgi:hypothetical protein